MKQEEVKLSQLFWKFFKIGLFTFGGGFAMIPLIEREILKNNWIKSEDVVDLVAISQSIPGAVAINMSLFTGYRIRGKRGAITSVLGCISPSILVILIIAMVFSQFQDNPYVQYAFTGVLSAIVALILVSAIRLAKKVIFDWITLTITVLTVLGLILTPINPIFFIIGGALTGILFYYLYPKKVREVLTRGEGKK